MNINRKSFNRMVERVQKMDGVSIFWVGCTPYSTDGNLNYKFQEWKLYQEALLAIANEILALGIYTPQNFRQGMGFAGEVSRRLDAAGYPNEMTAQEEDIFSYFGPEWVEEYKKGL